MNDKHTFFDSSDMNIVFRSVPISILSLANSNSVAVNFSPPSTAALMAAIFTKFARSDRKKRKKKCGEGSVEGDFQTLGEINIYLLCFL